MQDRQEQIQASYLLEPHNEFTACFHFPGVKEQQKTKVGGGALVTFSQ